MRYLAATLLVVLSSPVSARGHRAWTQQELIDESDFVAIVTSEKPVPVPNTHDFVAKAGTMRAYLQQHESKLNILAVLKGDQKPQSVILVHFLKRRDIEVGVENGPSYVWMGTTKFSQSNGFIAERLPRYLVYLRRGREGKFEPTTGNMDPGDSIVRILPFPEWDPAMDGVTEVHAAPLKNYRSDFGTGFYTCVVTQQALDDAEKWTSVGSPLPINKDKAVEIAAKCIEKLRADDNERDWSLTSATSVRVATEQEFFLVTFERPSERTDSSVETKPAHSRILVPVLVDGRIPEFKRTDYSDATMNLIRDLGLGSTVPEPEPSVATEAAD